MRCGATIRQRGQPALNRSRRRWLCHQYIWLLPEAGDGDQIYGGDDGSGGWMPLAVATANGTAGVANETLRYIHSTHLGVPVGTFSSTGTASPLPAGTMLLVPVLGHAPHGLRADTPGQQQTPSLASPGASAGAAPISTTTNTATTTPPPGATSRPIRSAWRVMPTPTAMRAATPWGWLIRWGSPKSYFSALLMIGQCTGQQGVILISSAYAEFTVTVLQGQFWRIMLWTTETDGLTPDRSQI